VIGGKVSPGFEAVGDAFAANFERPEAYRELGASLAVYRHGECVVDLWGGYADRAKARPWTRDSLVNLWSTTKGIAALCITIFAARAAGAAAAQRDAAEAARSAESTEGKA